MFVKQKNCEEKKGIGSQGGQKAEPEKYLVIEYPKENEVINPPHYAVKIGTNEHSKVEISIDNGDWQPCRHSGGFWWYDWTGYISGAHNIAAHVLGNNKKVLLKSKVRKCLAKD